MYTVPSKFSQGHSSLSIALHTLRDGQRQRLNDDTTDLAKMKRCLNNHYAGPNLREQLITRTKKKQIVQTLNLEAGTKLAGQVEEITTRRKLTSNPRRRSFSEPPAKTVKLSTVREHVENIYKSPDAIPNAGEADAEVRKRRCFNYYEKQMPSSVTFGSIGTVGEYLHDSKHRPEEMLPLYEWERHQATSTREPYTETNEERQEITEHSTGSVYYHDPTLEDVKPNLRMHYPSGVWKISKTAFSALPTTADSKALDHYTGSETVRPWSQGRPVDKTKISGRPGTGANKLPFGQSADGGSLDPCHGGLSRIVCRRGNSAFGDPCRGSQSTNGSRSERRKGWACLDDIDSWCYYSATKKNRNYLPPSQYKVYEAKYYRQIDEIRENQINAGIFMLLRKDHLRCVMKLRLRVLGDLMNREAFE